MKSNLFFKTGLAVFALILYSSTLRAYTAVASGNWSNSATWGGTAPGATVSNQDIVIPYGITVGLDMDVSFSGLSNSFTVDGSIANAGTTGITLVQGTFSGSGSVAAHRVTFSSLAAVTFSGNMNLNVLVNEGAAVALGAVVTITDTLNLDAGSILLNTGGNMVLQTNSTVRVNNGSLSIHGGVFNNTNSYNVVYVGASKTTGIELNTLTLGQLYINLSDNTQTLTLGNDLLVNGALSVSAGAFDFSGRQLTLRSDLVMGKGTAFTSNTSSQLIIESDGMITSALNFSAGSSIQVLSVHLTSNGKVGLASSLGIAGYLKLMLGALSIENGATVTAQSGSIVHIEYGSMIMNGGAFNGTASYDVEYMGGPLPGGVELTGAGLNNVTVSLTAPSPSAISLNGNVAVAGKLNLIFGSINLNGYNLALNGTFFSSGTGSIIGHINSELDVNLAGYASGALVFDASNQQLKTLSINIANGGSITMGSPLSINTLLNFSNGLIDIAGNDLIILSTASITGYSDTRYVITSGTGRLQLFVKSGSPSVLFPIGTATGYAPGTIQQVGGGSSGNFMIHVMDGVYAGGTSGYNSAAISSVVNHTWLIEAASGTTVNMSLSLAWTAAAEVNGFDRSQSYISHFVNAQWDTYAVASASAGANNTYVMNRTGITSLSPFTVADNKAALGIQEAVTLPAIQFYPNPATSELNVEIRENETTWLYEIIDVTGKTVFSTLSNTPINRFAVNELENGSYFMRISNPVDHRTFVKRFVKI